MLSWHGRCYFSLPQSSPCLSPTKEWLELSEISQKCSDFFQLISDIFLMHSDFSSSISEFLLISFSTISNTPTDDRCFCLVIWSHHILFSTCDNSIILQETAIYTYKNIPIHWVKWKICVYLPQLSRISFKFLFKSSTQETLLYHKSSLFVHE